MLMPRAKKSSARLVKDERRPPTAVNAVTLISADLLMPLSPRSGAGRRVKSALAFAFHRLVVMLTMLLCRRAPYIAFDTFVISRRRHYFYVVRHVYANDADVDATVRYTLLCQRVARCLAFV